MSGLTSLETSAEVRLLGALCRPRESSPTGEAAFRTLLDRIDDWPHFVALLKHHRLAPMAARNQVFVGMAQLPAEIKAELHASSVANAREAFRYLSVLQQWLVLLENEGIGAVVIKGVPLSIMAYGDVSARDVGDIDLLIDARHALRADELLRQTGLRRQEPAAELSARRAAFFLRTFKDFTYEAPNGGFELDLHWRLTRDSATASAIMTDQIDQCCETLRIGTLGLQVLTPVRTLLLLSVHGATEAWARWKTLADIAALWAKATSAQQDTTWKLAVESSTVGFLAAALILAGDWFGMTCGEDAVTQMEGAVPPQQRICRQIVARTRRRMRQYAYMPSPAGSSTFAMKLHEAQLHPSAKSRIELAQRILFRPRIWQVVDLPDSLFPLYPLLSPLEWLAFRAKRTLGRGGRR